MPHFTTEAPVTSKGRVPCAKRFLGSLGNPSPKAEHLHQVLGFSRHDTPTNSPIKAPAALHPKETPPLHFGFAHLSNLLVNTFMLQAGTTGVYKTHGSVFIAKKTDTLGVHTHNTTPQVWLDVINQGTIWLRLTAPLNSTIV